MIDEELFKSYAETSLQFRRIMSRRTGGEFNMQQFITLHIIVKNTDSENSEYNVTGITNQTDMAMPNVVRMLNEMQMKNYIKRRRDGRNVFVSITEDGKKYHDWCMDISNKHLKDLLVELERSDVSDEEINQYMSTSVKLFNIYFDHINNPEKHA